MVSLSGLIFFHAANTFYFLFLRSFDGQGWKTAFRSLSTEAEVGLSANIDIFNLFISMAVKGYYTDQTKKQRDFGYCIV